MHVRFAIHCNPKRTEFRQIGRPFGIVRGSWPKFYLLPLLIFLREIFFSPEEKLELGNTRFLLLGNSDIGFLTNVTIVHTYQNMDDEKRPATISLY